jgi:biotin-dependent carboxylase-like uncharacterized protein
MLKVLKGGFFTSIQDKGRSGFANIGVPISGVMDSYSADLANTILNNNLEDAVLEITLGACSFQFLEKTFICISGGNFSPTINDASIQLNKRIAVNENDVLSFGKVNFGVRCYLAVKDGFLSEKKLNSSSFYQNITKNSFIKKGDVLSFLTIENNFINSNTFTKVTQNHFNNSEIECFKGPEFDELNQHQKEKLAIQTFSISNDNNRMGYKLNEILENNLPQILTSAVLPGTVQLTPSGKLIVLMRDCQVTGGYPRILQLTENSINIIAQKKVSDNFTFIVNI